MISIPKNLAIHTCYSCKRTMEDDDFIRVGIAVFPDLRWTFDYRCHHCAYHGRYMIAAPKKMTPTRALFRLSKVVKNRASPKLTEDWDSVK